MTVLDVNGAIDNVKTLLSGLAAWQSICDVASSSEAAERIHKGGIEDGGRYSETPYIILDIDPLQLEWKPNALHSDLTIEARFELEVPAENCGTYAEQYTWTWQQYGAMLRGVAAGTNGAGQLMLRDVTTPLKPGRIDPDDTGGRVEWLFTLGLVIDFI